MVWSVLFNLNCSTAEVHQCRFSGNVNVFRATTIGTAKRGSQVMIVIIMINEFQRAVTCVNLFLSIVDRNPLPQGDGRRYAGYAVHGDTQQAIHVLLHAHGGGLHEVHGLQLHEAWLLARPGHDLAAADGWADLSSGHGGWNPKFQPPQPASLIWRVNRFHPLY